MTSAPMPRSEKQLIANASRPTKIFKLINHRLSFPSMNRDFEIDSQVRLLLKAKNEHHCSLSGDLFNLSSIHRPLSKGKMHGDIESRVDRKDRAFIRALINKSSLFCKPHWRDQAISDLP